MCNVTREEEEGTCAVAAAAAAGAETRMVDGEDSRVEDGMKSGVARWSNGSPSSQRCSCSRLLRRESVTMTTELITWRRSEEIQE